MAFDVAGMSQKPANARSLPSLLYKIEKQGYTYYRPNLSYTSASHKKRQLRWLVSLIFDFDAEHLVQLKINSHVELIRHVESFGYVVSGVIKTSSGFHVYLPMNPVRGCWNGASTIQRYDEVLKSIARQIGSDPAAASAEHYFRAPNKANVVYFFPADKPDFDFYERAVEELNNRSESRSEQVWFGRMMSQPAMLRLLSGDFNTSAWANAENGGRKVGRNNAAFTLALGMKFDGWTIEQALNELSVWFHSRINKKGFVWREVQNAVRHAYEGQYKGPSARYVEAFTGMKLRPLSKRKAKEEKTRMQFKETEEILITYLQRYYLEFQKDLCMSQAELAKRIGVKLRSLQHVLKEMQKTGALTLETRREGRSNVSMYFLSEELLPQEKAEEAEPVVTAGPQDGTAAPADTEKAVWEAPRAPQAKLAAVLRIHSAIAFTSFFELLVSRTRLILPHLLDPDGG
ncbi:hypothetical protein ACFSR7_05835 [Cohnella sp. GCM10020058]|uniref:hypothetical protein n=1 Tax=Cohnella sp. GCM10020058 TaxID=3317330 RepID=UPI00363EEEAC